MSRDVLDRLRCSLERDEILGSEPKPNRLAIIRRYFEAQPHGRKMTTAEARAMTPEDREELAAGIEREGHCD